MVTRVVYEIPPKNVPVSQDLARMANNDTAFQCSANVPVSQDLARMANGNGIPVFPPMIVASQCSANVPGSPECVRVPDCIQMAANVAVLPGSLPGCHPRNLVSEIA